ncbi:MAG: hypothetical protein C5B59_07290 [Bacteroidetes bacterium]|nr:MAG: hypothetical protein C5B59_07290 [Bacteroidota bacterium]
MQNLSIISRYLYAVAIAVFGLQYFIYGDFVPTLFPVPDTVPARIIWVIIIACVLIVAGVFIAGKLKSRLTATILGLFFLFLFLVLHIPKIVRSPHDAIAWTSAFEVLAMVGGAWILADTLPSVALGQRVQPNALDKIITTGPYLFAISLTVFGVQHFMYTENIVALIPGWVPGPILWSYLIGCIFFAVALSIFLKKKTRLAAVLLGTMFLSWVLLLHIPRVLANVQKQDEWTNAFVALAMSGISFTLAAALKEKNR